MVIGAGAVLLSHSSLLEQQQPSTAKHHARGVDPKRRRDVAVSDRSVPRLQSDNAPRAPPSAKEVNAPASSSSSTPDTAGMAWPGRWTSRPSQHDVIATNACRTNAVPGRLSARSAMATPWPQTATGHHDKPLGELGKPTCELHRYPAAEGVPDDGGPVQVEGHKQVARSGGIGPQRIGSPDL
jgi:hypothetical protein